MQFKTAFALTSLLLIGLFVSAQDYVYTMTWLEPHTHTYRITAEVEPETKGYTDFRMPSWRPGRYRLQNYSAAVTQPSASDEKGKTLKLEKVDKDTWRVRHGILDKVRFTYDIYAANIAAGSSYRGDGYAYFNPVNLFVYVPGRLDQPVTLDVPELPANWKVATQLKRESKTRFSAPSYHYFVDSPTVLAKDMKQLSFKDKNTTFYLHFHGDYQGNKEVDDALIDGTRKIVQELGAIFGEDYPFEEYHFIYRLLPIRYRHAVEHTNSASFTLPSTVTANTRSIVGGVFGITAHEFFHAWNVKRIRPAALWPYDYSQPQYTSLHWFTEGVTDYYTNLTLVRSGLIDNENFYSRMTRVIDALDNRSASQFIAPSMQSYDSWIESSDYSHPFHNVSYYTSGGRLGLLIDGQLAKLTKGEKCMDDVFRYLYQNYYKQDKGVPENGIQKALEEISGASWETFFNQYIHGTTPIDYKRLLAPLGLKLNQELDEETGARRLGILRHNNTGQSLSVDGINQQGDAWKAGIGKDDLIFRVNGKDATDIDFDEVCDKLEKGDKLKMQIFSGINFKDVTLRYEASFTPQASVLEEAKKNQAVREKWLRSRK